MPPVARNRVCTGTVALPPLGRCSSSSFFHPVPAGVEVDVDHPGIEHDVDPRHRRVAILRRRVAEVPQRVGELEMQRRQVLRMPEQVALDPGRTGLLLERREVQPALRSGRCR